VWVPLLGGWIGEISNHLDGETIGGSRTGSQGGGIGPTTYHKEKRTQSPHMALAPPYGNTTQLPAHPNPNPNPNPNSIP